MYLFLMGNNFKRPASPVLYLQCSNGSEFLKKIIYFFPFSKKLPFIIYQGFPDNSAGKESTCNAGDLNSIPQSGRSTGEGIGYISTPVFLGFPCGSTGKESACNVGDLGSIPRLGRSPGEGKDYPLPYSGLEKSMDCIVHGFAKSLKGLNNFHFHFHNVSGLRSCRELILGNVYRLSVDI